MTYLRFGIRDLLWAMVVVGLALALWQEHRRVSALESNNRYLLKAIDNSGFVAGGNFLGACLERPRPD